MDCKTATSFTVDHKAEDLTAHLFFVCLFSKQAIFENEGRSTRFVPCVRPSESTSKHEGHTHIH